MAWFGSSAPALASGQVTRKGSLPTAPGAVPNPLGSPTPPPGVLATASSSIGAAQAAALRQKKLATAAQPLIGGSTTAPTAQIQPKTLVGY